MPRYGVPGGVSPPGTFYFYCITYYFLKVIGDRERRENLSAEVFSPFAIAYYALSGGKI